MENTSREVTTEVQLTGLVENPTKLIQHANLVAVEFHKIVDGQKMFTQIQKSKHIHADGWSMLGVLLGVFPEVLSTERVACGKFDAALVVRTNSYGKNYQVWTDKDRMKKTDQVIEEREKEEIKYKAVVALNTLGGRKLAQITTMCSNREDGKVDNDEYAIESMAQTRGTGKVYRTAFGWIAKMAGYDSTPFEEATGEMYEEPTKPPASADLMESIFNRIELSRDEKELAVVVDAIASYSKELNEGDTKALRQAVIAKRNFFIESKKAPAKSPEAKKTTAKREKKDEPQEEKAPVPEPQEYRGASEPYIAEADIDHQNSEIKEPAKGIIADDQIVDQQTGEVIARAKALESEPEKQESVKAQAEPAQAKKKEPSKYWTMAKIASMVDGLRTIDEVNGFRAEINDLYNEGELTETVWKFAINNLQVKMNKTVKEKNEKPEQATI